LKIALTTPAACASCFGQYPDRTHIDFEAAYDGPVINSDDNIKMPVDDLIICEDCLQEAFRLIPDERTERIAELERELEGQRERLVGKDVYIRQLEESVARKTLPEVPRPKVVA
jgi:hypothetical protein